MPAAENEQMWQRHQAAANLSRPMSNSVADVVSPRADDFCPLSAEQAVLFEASPFPVLVLDGAYRIRYVNAASAAFGDVDRSSLIGVNVWSRYPALEGGIFHQAYAAVLQHRVPQRFEEHRPDEDVWLSVFAYPADDGVVAVLEDVTRQRRAERERDRAEAQLQQAQKLESLGLLAGGIAHDFNNLLVAMLGNASLALLDLEPDARARQSVEEIEHAAQRAADLTRQLLAYAGKGRFVIESVDASAVVTEMAALLRTAVSRNATIELDLATTLPSIEVDSTQFRQVVMNLITNASDALVDQPGRIILRTGRQTLSQSYLEACVPGTDATPGDFVYVEVRDTGSGMDAATQRRIFDPFFSTKFTGRGLGLAATLGIMRGHRGAIHVYSEIDNGTSFKLHFPASAHSAAPPKLSSNSAWLGSGRVLIVDDDHGVRAVARGLLQRRGFEVVEAESGDAALQVYGADPSAFAMVLLDLTMPGRSGDDTFRAIRSIREDARVVLMSGYNEQDVTQLFVGRGLAAFLQKPFRAEELYDTIARTLNIESRDRP
jgi:signal transduction histidine kinase/ActR/RegA family two-component response regulator